MMKTYKTYQDCKIANPECEIYHLKDKGLFTYCTHHKAEIVRFVEFDSDGIKCHPSDHCMTVEGFLKTGHKFEVGDLWIDYDGDFMTVVEPGVNHMNKPHERDFERYILRAAALEKPKRTKVEYEKVEFEPNEIWKAFKEHQEVGYLYVNTSDGFECLFDGVFNLAMAISQGDQLYRRIEIEIDERQEFIDEYIKQRNEFAKQNTTIDFCEFLVNSGKFKLVN